MVTRSKKQEAKQYLTDSTTVKQYKGEPLKVWKWAKEMRLRYYKDFAEAHEKGGLRVAGGSWSFGLPVSAALGDDVYYLASEPYAASTAFDTEFSKRCTEAAAAHGWAGDICSYMKNYLGCIYLDEYAFGGPFPKPDIIFQEHICCAHAKWYQAVHELEGREPLFLCTDVSVGPYEIAPGAEKLKEHRLNYVVDQLLDAIDEVDKYAQKKWGRRFDDEKFIEAVNNDCNAGALWAEICVLNQAVPAPLDEKTMFPLFAMAPTNRQRREVTDFYKALRDEVKDRIARGVAAVPTERFRVLGTSPVPWYFLEIFRYLEQYGCVSVGSFYNFYLHGFWEEDEYGNRLPRKTPEQLGIKMKTREDAARVIADWNLSNTYWKYPYFPELGSDTMIKTVKQWKCDGVITHYNRGCHLTTMYAPEIRLALIEAGIPVMAYEGDMADKADFDKARTLSRIDSFMESLGLRRLEG